MQKENLIKQSLKQYKNKMRSYSSDKHNNTITNILIQDLLIGSQNTIRSKLNGRQASLKKDNKQNSTSIKASRQSSKQVLTQKKLNNFMTLNNSVYEKQIINEKQNNKINKNCISDKKQNTKTIEQSNNKTTQKQVILALSQSFNKQQFLKFKYEKSILYLTDKNKQAQQKLKQLQLSINNYVQTVNQLEYKLSIIEDQLQKYKNYLNSSNKTIQTMRKKENNNQNQRKLLLQHTQTIQSQVKINKLMQIIRKKDQSLTTQKKQNIKLMKNNQNIQKLDKQIHSLKQTIIRSKHNELQLQRSSKIFQNKAHQLQTQCNLRCKNLQKAHKKVQYLQRQNKDLQNKLRNAIKQVEQNRYQSRQIQFQFKSIICSLSKQVKFLQSQIELKQSVQQQLSKSSQNNQASSGFSQQILNQQNMQLSFYMKDISKILNQQMGCFNNKKIKCAQHQILQILTKFNDGWLRVVNQIQTIVLNTYRNSDSSITS